MFKQLELINKILRKLNEEEILEHLLIVGSWSLYFYQHHYKEANLPPLRTEDIDIDAGFLRKLKKPVVDILEILKDFGFDVDFHGDGSISLICEIDKERFKVEFLVPETGRPAHDPIKIKGFGISAQPLRWLDILEEDFLTVDYDGMKINIPHPARFAVHKLIISQRRQKLRGTGESPKVKRDITQALNVIKMLSEMKRSGEVTELANTLSKKQKKLIKQALSRTEIVRLSGMLTEELEEIFNFTS